ncbi:chitin-binding domain protein cbd-1-like [Gigantopelta aegis]|uniref:chitin-binding domain protein cbd-1-like n=1 Tax=Gigantopelta aegis TaxID=1735272 RepID=UPI001B88E6F7|nr:chitin-binding domain protein cbd-1-like [Gigantopelta aegis]
MHVLAFTFLVVLLPTVFCGQCSTRVDGTYNLNCHQFVRCENQVATVISCPQHHVFDRITGKCDESVNVAPPCGIFKACVTKGDGRYAELAKHCRSYYTCRGGILLGHNVCTPGTVFNEDLQTCDWPSDVKQPCGTKP